MGLTTVQISSLILFLTISETMFIWYLSILPALIDSESYTSFRTIPLGTKDHQQELDRRP